jgi:hypothetical protein
MSAEEFFARPLASKQELMRAVLDGWDEDQRSVLVAADVIDEPPERGFINLRWIVVKYRRSIRDIIARVLFTFAHPAMCAQWETWPVKNFRIRWHDDQLVSLKSDTIQASVFASPERFEIEIW